MTDVELRCNDRESPSKETSEEEKVNVATHVPPTPPIPVSYPPPLIFAINMFALYLSIFCVALDNTIISTAIPQITDRFHALDDVGWYGSGW